MAQGTEPKPNGNEGTAESVPAVYLQLTFDPGTFRLHIAGQVLNDDCAVAMLEQALRWYKNKMRIEAALQARAQLNENARVAAIVDSVRRGK